MEILQLVGVDGGGTICAFVCSKWGLVEVCKQIKLEKADGKKDMILILVL